MTPSDVARMTEALFTEEGDAARKRSRFWVLLVLSAVIAAAGVVADSTATVIGAMIVAPLMTPIIGTALAVVLADRRNLSGSVLLIAGGAALVVAVSFVLGLAVPVDVVAATNGQVSGRVSPRLIDLVAALATGAVGAVALCRPDISDTLPGVAIAISLVPPLAVVGLTLEAGAAGEAAGALLLFGTNVAAIVVTGTVVLLGYRVRDAAREGGRRVGRLRGRTLVTVGALVALVAVPLAFGSYRVYRAEVTVRDATPVAEDWAEGAGWTVREVTVRDGVLRITAIGPLPAPEEADLRAALDRAGLGDTDAEVTLVVGGDRPLPAAG